MTTLAELKLRAADMLARRGGACACPKDKRQPRVERVGGMALTRCQTCGGYTKEVA